MDSPTPTELTAAILRLRADALLAECFGRDWFRRGDPRPLLPLTFTEFVVEAERQGIPAEVLVEDVWSGHEHYVIALRNGRWLMGYAERGRVDLRSDHATREAARQAVLNELWNIYQSAGNPEHRQGGVTAGTPFPILPDLHYAPTFRRWSLFGVVFLGAMAFIGWLAYRLEGVSVGLALAGPLAGAGLAWLWALSAAPQWARFGPSSLTLRRWWNTTCLTYAEITAVTRSYAFITLHTADRRVRLYKLHANDDARLLQALEQVVPIAQQSREQRLLAEFPIVLHGRGGAVWLTALIGLGLMAFGSVAIWWTWAGTAVSNLTASLCSGLVGLLCAAYGLLFLYLTLWTYPGRVVFTSDQMTQHFLLHTNVQPMTGVTAFQPSYELRSVRGVRRKLYAVTFLYENGDSFRWIPNEFYFPIDYLDAVEAQLAQELTERLRRAYLTS
jgi:hypothetical protein